MSAGRVHLLYGLAGSGKTTRARQLAAHGGAVRFTLDEWMLRLYPEQASDRAERRAAAGAHDAHRITRAGNEHLATLMEPPHADKGVQVVHE